MQIYGDDFDIISPRQKKCIVWDWYKMRSPGKFGLKQIELVKSHSHGDSLSDSFNLLGLKHGGFL